MRARWKLFSLLVVCLCTTPAFADAEEDLFEATQQLRSELSLSHPEALRHVVTAPDNSPVLLLTAVRQEAARKLGVWASGFADGSFESHSTLEFLHGYVNDPAIGAAAVDGMMLVGKARPSVTERLLQVVKNPKAAADARIRAIQWIRHEGVAKLKAGSTLLHATRDFSAPFVQLSACHALLASGDNSPEVRSRLHQLGSDSRLGDSQSYARRLARPDSDPAQTPERTAGPALAKICRLVNSAVAAP